MVLAHHHQLDARPATDRWVGAGRAARGRNGPRVSADVDGADAEILRRARLLLPRDRSIIELTVRNRASRQAIARTLGLAPGTVSRRLQRLSARLHDPLVIALLDPACPLAPEYRQVGVEHFLQGLPARHIADKHRMGEVQVRAMIALIRQWHAIERRKGAT